MKKELTIKFLCKEVSVFAEAESSHTEPTIYGVTDGKAVGTYLEHKFQTYLREKYTYEEGSSARGIDFPKLGVDIVAFMQDRLLPVEEIQALQIADEIIANPPNIGYLTISNAFQWRLQYRRAIEEAGKVDEIYRIR